MILVDANVLLYAVNESAPRHAAAKRWMEDVLNGNEPIAFAWAALLAFLRIATQPALSPQPLEVKQALDIIEEWLAVEVTTVVHPTNRHAAILRGLLEPSGSAGNLAGDAHLAALSVEHGARICSFDRDFQRFPGITVLVPQ